MKMYFGCLIIVTFIFISTKIYGSATDLLIIFSGEELGNLEPCGCFEGQIGGISRRYALIDSFRKQKKIILPVSLGDLTKSSGRQEVIKMEILCCALERMDYILHNLGEKDLEVGPQLISYLSQTNKVAFLSSNVQITSPFPTKINKYVLKEYVDSKNSFKIAFLGILSKSFFNNNISDFVNIIEPIKALELLVKQLHDKANLIILLSHAPLGESIEIAKLFPEIGLIITGHGIEEPKDSITYVNNTAIVSSGTGGKYIGVAEYSINNKLAPLYAKVFTKSKSVEIIPLDNKYKDSLEMVSLLKDYQQMLMDEDLLSKTPQMPLLNGLSYVGNLTCGTCHKLVYDHWSKTQHGVSYNTLVNKGHQYDPECIRCHTTGYGFISGFLNYENNQNLINVGCESCHGAGSEHVKNVSNVYGVTDESICDMCHDNEHSPEFQFKGYWERIKHPKEFLKKLPNP